MMDFKKFEKLSQTEYGTIRNLIVEEGLVANSQIEQIIEQVTKDRFNLGKSKADFARTLDENEPEACKVIITLCYYAMYHSCRAAIFHTHRNDVDVHEKVASEIGKIVGEHLEKSLDFWRAVRNEVDYSPYPALEHPLKELALKAISSATFCLAEVENYLAKRGVKI
jgi:CMP-2-keto-3-deoxyoctulosonic acid synthetase